MQGAHEPGAGLDAGQVSADADLPVHQRRGVWCIAAGLFLLVLGVYVLTAPGRIDIIDGQTRFDVANNWLQYGRPVVTDKWIGPLTGVPGPNGQRFSYYGAPGSAFSMPLMWWGMHLSAEDIQLRQFLFSFTSPIFGAAITPLLFLFYMELGVSRRRALFWALVSAFATYVWAISNSTFDNAQHAFFTFAAVYFGFLGARRRSVMFAALGGLAAGMLFIYQEYFLLIMPALALSTVAWKAGTRTATQETGRRSLFTLPGRAGSAIQARWLDLRSMIRSAWQQPGEDRDACIRYCVFLASISVGIGLALGYNEFRFGSWFNNGKVMRPYPPMWGNPIAGLLTLLISPGKSVLLYSPVIIVAFMGIRGLYRRAPQLVLLAAAASALLLLFISCIRFAGGDWCWGPRYLTPLLPLWGLALPFAMEGAAKRTRWAAGATIALSFLVQGLGLSVENQRFFLQRALPDQFWAEDSWFYMTHSALFARVGETLSLRDGVPPTATGFNSIPIPSWTTYCPLGPPSGMPRASAPEWIRNFQIYFLPRPWPLWMSWLPPEIRPIQVLTWMLRFAAMVIAGLCLITAGFRRATTHT